MVKLLALLLTLFLLACSSEKPSDMNVQKTAETENGPYSLEITPVNATRNATIYAVPRGFELSNATIDWLVNKAPSESSAQGQFAASGARKNDTVQARAMVQGQEVLSNVIQIQNSPPEVSHAKILQPAGKPGDALSVEATGSDIDDDEVIISYEWTRNGEPAGNGVQMEGSLKKGDKISVKITPFDGEAYGRPIIIQRDVQNAKPVIFENRKFGFEANTYTYQVKAADSDEDSLTYSLKSGPAGMTINSSTGLIKWNVPPEFIGKTSFTVSVSDGHGGEAVQTFPFEMRLEQRR
jgi:hypothetical protein